VATPRRLTAPRVFPQRSGGLFSNPFASVPKAQRRPRIEHALLTPLLTSRVAGGGRLLAGFYRFFALDLESVCGCAFRVDATRIRSNGMSFALLINQAVSTMIAAVFLPCGQHGYSAFLFFAGCTVIYFLVAWLSFRKQRVKALKKSRVILKAHPDASEHELREGMMSWLDA